MPVCFVICELIHIMYLGTKREGNKLLKFLRKHLKLNSYEYVNSKKAFVLHFVDE